MTNQTNRSGDADLQDGAVTEPQTGRLPGSLPAATRDAQPSDARASEAQSSEAQADYGLHVLPPLSAVVELSAIVLVIMAADWLWPALDINGLQPSPYWIPVLLLSLQYGTASGSLAVFVAIAAYFAFVTLPEQGVGENEFAYRLRILAQPILWIATAVLLGQFRMVQISAKRELKHRVGELELQTRTLADYANRLRKRCDTLERDIVARGVPGQSGILEALGALRLSGAVDAATLETCLASALPGAAVSLFVRQGVALKTLVSAGWPEDAAWLTSLPLDHPLVATVAGGRRSLCVLTAGDEASLAGQGLAAVPILDDATGRVLGMVKIERCTGQLVTPDLIGHLEVLAACLRPYLDDVGGDTRLRLPKEGVLVPRLQPRVAVANGTGPGDDAGVHLVRPKVGR